LNICKPKVVVSSCLLGEKVRYDGGSVSDSNVEDILKFAQPIGVCPEVGIGLPVPREKVFLQRDKNDLKLIQEKSGKDFTKEMGDFSQRFLSNLKGVDGFILKGKSPSCGITGAKTYKNKDRTGYIGRRTGLFAREVKKKFPCLPAADEILLKDKEFRDLFLIRLFLSCLHREKGGEYILKNFRGLLKLFNKTGLKRFEKDLSWENLHRILCRKPKDIKEAVHLGRNILLRNIVA